jgi:ABC-2 type transport system ATP-binding protein
VGDDVIVEFDGVRKAYNGTLALDEATLTVEEGSVVGLIGPNGAGKTTSMLIITSLLRRDGGRVRVGGVDPQVAPVAVRQHVGYMPDFFGVYEGFTSREYLEFFAATQNIRPTARPAVVADLLALVDLEHKADADVNGLSRGMKQRLSLARALVHDPDLLVLDEPASGLDPRARVELRELITELNRMGRTIIISSHILSELEGICSHLAIVDHGKVVAEGPVDSIRQRLRATRRIEATVAAASAARLEAILRSRADVSDIDVEVNRTSFVLDGDERASAALLKEIVEAEVPVAGWQMRTLGLEELFLQLTDEKGEDGQ